MTFSLLCRDNDIFDHLPREIHSIPIAKQLLIEEIENAYQLTAETDGNRHVIGQILKKLAPDWKLHGENSVIAKNQAHIHEDKADNLHNTNGNDYNNDPVCLNKENHIKQIKVEDEKGHLANYSIQYDHDSKEKETSDQKKRKTGMSDNEQLVFNLEHDPHILNLIQKYSDFILECCNSKKSSSTRWFEWLWNNIVYILKSVGILIIGGFLVVIVWDCWWQMWGGIWGKLFSLFVQLKTCID